MSIDLKSIVTGARMKPPKVTLYGVGGIGKTTWAAAAPDPIFCFTEEGQGLLDVARFEPRDADPVLRSWEELLACVELLYKEEHDYKTVVVDSLDMAEPLLWAHTSTKYGQRDIEAFGYGKGYTYAVDEARGLMARLDALRNHRNMAVVLICHAECKKWNAPDSEAYDRYKLRLQDRFAAYVHDWSDALLFANYRTTVVSDEEGFQKKRKRAVGVGERVLYTQEGAAFWAKNRYRLPPELPLDWNKFVGAIDVPKPAPAKPKARKPKKAEA